MMHGQRMTSERLPKRAVVQRGGGERKWLLTRKRDLGTQSIGIEYVQKGHAAGAEKLALVRLPLPLPRLLYRQAGGSPPR